MSVLLVIRFDVESADTTKNFNEDGAKKLAQLPGLQWKIWTANLHKNEGAGFYLYATRRDAEIRAKQAGPHLSALPGISNVTTEIYDIYEDWTRITRGPLDVEANPSYPEDIEA